MVHNHLDDFPPISRRERIKQAAAKHSVEAFTLLMAARDLRSAASYLTIGGKNQRTSETILRIAKRADERRRRLMRKAT